MQQAGWLLPASLTGYLWLKGHQPGLPGWGCPFRAITGVPCPGCFLTRATISALHGDLTTSVSLHAFGPVMAAGLIAWSAMAIQRRRLWPFPWRLRPGLALATAVGGYWLLRLVLSQVFGLAAPWGFPGSG